jgi:hypothetical protein
MTIPSNFDLTTPKGWQCPKCGKIWSPSMISCPHCNQPQWSFTAPTTSELTEWMRWNRIDRNSAGNYPE